jgi:NADP-dependent 3-hydroxy acid dehydrogenase YdfG
MLRSDDVARAIASLLEQPPYVTVEDLVIGHTAGRL